MEQVCPAALRMTNYPEVQELKTILNLGSWIMWVTRAQKDWLVSALPSEARTGRLMTVSDAMLVP